MASGERRDPATAPIVHGVYARRLPSALREVVSEFRAEGDRLFDLETMAARMWALLVRADELEAAFNVEELGDLDAPEELCKCGRFYRRAELAKDMADRLRAVRGILRELTEITRIKFKLDDAGPTVTKGQLVGALAIVLRWVQELQEDESIPREEIHGRLVERFKDATGWI